MKTAMETVETTMEAAAATPTPSRCRPGNGGCDGHR
jgi:hypothetical protein